MQQPVNVAMAGTARMPPCVVAVPVRNEAERIGHCLDALAAQDARTDFGVVLFLNGCTDGTWGIALGILHGWRRPWRMIHAVLPEGHDHAGGARLAAMDVALSLMPRVGDAMLLSTDADSTVPAHWVARNAQALATCDAVAGHVDVEQGEFETLPPPLIERHHLEARYATLLAAIDAACDPLAHDPWPNHRTHSGASLGFRADSLRRVLPMDAPPHGEGDALVHALLSRNAVVRHDPDITVATSARIYGRAEGGMAETLRLRMTDQSAPCDALLEPAADLVCRATLRARARDAFQPRMRPHTLATRLGLTHAASASPACRGFHDAWRWIENHVAMLAPRAVHPDALPDEIERATRFLAGRAA
jgi:hypothetical protein